MISGSSSFSQYPPANVTVAVSNNTDPFVWKVYNICAGQGGVCPTTYFPDQPILGVSDDKVAISVNDYANGGASIGAQYWILNKSEMLSGAQTVDEYSHGPDSRFFSIHPVQSLSSTTTQYMVSTRGCCASNVTLFSITGVPPNFVANSTVVLPISTMTIPPNGFQPETPSRVDSGRRWSPTICRDPPCVPPPSVSISGSGNRILSAVWFEGILWYTANDGCVPPGDSRQRSCVRLTQIDTGTATVTQDFDYAANGTYYFYPAVSIDKNGDLDMVFGFSSNTTYPSLAITGQARGDMSGALAPAITVKTGTAAATGGRYGDYFGAGIDPANPTTIWVAGQYGNSTDGTWATFIASMNVIRVGGPSDFSMSTICDYISPSTCGSSVITMASINGFAGTVSLSATASPSSGITPSLTPTSVSIPAGGNANSTLTVSTSCHSKTYCLWHVNVTGTSDALSHNISILVCAGRGCPQ